MKMLKKFLSALRELAVVVGVLVGALFLIPFVAGTPDFWDKNPEILVALVIGLLPSAVVLYVQNRKEEQDRYTQNRKEEQRRHKWLLENRASVLEELVYVYGKAVSLARLPDNSPQKKKSFEDIVKRTLENKSKLIVWAPLSVIRALQDAEDASFVRKDSPEYFLGIVDELFRIIRKELDHNDSGLEKYELLGLYLLPDAREELGLESRIKE
ncbi:MAG: hypothetical protein MPK62_03855 [Alphaproteobacteria bacterium]|nr:hypothetical protein [Alphaproteobacteria bacterium]